MLQNLSPGSIDRGSHYRYYNTFTGRFIDANGTAVTLRGMDRRLPSGHTNGWEFSEVDGSFVGCNSDLTQIRAKLAGSGYVGDYDENDDDESVKGSQTSIEPIVNSSVATEPRTITSEEKVGCFRRYLRSIGKVSECGPQWFL